MKKNIEGKDWSNFFRGKSITVMGLGLLGRGVGDIEFLAKYAKEIIVTDLKTKKELKESVNKLKKYKNLRFVLGEHRSEDFEGRDFVLRAAGVPIDSPFIIHARKFGVPVYMSTALFSYLTKAKIVGITGTRGKTTVTNMLHGILKSNYAKSKTKVFLGGNIQGMATLPLIEKTKRGDIVVLELDSWQLQGFADLKISPELSIFTTFMPDHLNYYKGNIRAYFQDKAGIFRFQKDRSIFLAGEQLCSLPVSLTKLLPKSTHFISERVLPKKVKLKVPGEHNRYNAAIAFSAARALKIPLKKVINALEKFGGVPGRLEYLKTYRRIKIYNDTTSTTPEALIVALEALGVSRNISLIMGGTDKGIDLSRLNSVLNSHCSSLSLLSGTGTDRLIKEKVIPADVPYKIFNNIRSAFVDALKKTPINGVVLLSPGFASFGMFKNEYDRGDQFVSVVNLLK